MTDKFFKRLCPPQPPTVKQPLQQLPTVSTPIQDADPPRRIVTHQSSPDLIDVDNPPFVAIEANVEEDQFQDEAELQGHQEVEENFQEEMDAVKADDGAPDSPTFRDRLRAIAETSGVTLCCLQRPKDKFEHLREFIPKPSSAPSRQRLAFPAHDQLVSAQEVEHDVVVNSLDKKRNEPLVFPPPLIAPKARPHVPLYHPSFSLTSPPLDPDIQDMVKERANIHALKDSALQHIDTDARSLLAIGNYVAHTCSAMSAFIHSTDLIDSNPALYDAFNKVSSELSTMMDGAARISGAITNIRRDSLLQRSEFDRSTKDFLRTLPPDNDSLFGGRIAEAVGRRKDKEHAHEQLTHGLVQETATLNQRLAQKIPPTHQQKQGKPKPKPQNAPVKGNAGPQQAKVPAITTLPAKNRPFPQQHQGRGRGRGRGRGQK